MNKTTKKRKKRTKQIKPSKIKEIDEELVSLREKIAEIREVKCYPLLLSDASIGSNLVDDVYDDLTKEYGNCEKLDIIIDSGGGDIDAAFNLAQLLRRYGTEKLVFIVPRWAKSAATLVVCAGDEILMTPVAELGPIDPQITIMNPLEQRMEQFSPLHIESTLELIRDEYKNGSKELADGLMKRLQFPLTLGSFKKSLDIGAEYVKKLLTTRMFKDDHPSAKKIAEKLTKGYADHSYCIKLEEAKEIGLKANELTGDVLTFVWEIHKLCKKKDNIRQKQEQEKMKEQLENLPPEILRSLPTEITGMPKESGINNSNR